MRVRELPERWERSGDAEETTGVPGDSSKHQSDVQLLQERMQEEILPLLQDRQRLLSILQLRVVFEWQT